MSDSDDIDAGGRDFVVREQISGTASEPDRRQFYQVG